MAKSKNETQDTKEQTIECSSNAGSFDAAPAAPSAHNSTVVTQDENGLLPLAELAQRHRVPTWQQAALHTLMSWEDGKMVTDEEYQSGLTRLSGRRMGGV